MFDAILTWLKEPTNVVLVITSAVTIASAIVKITPTQKDDEYLDKAKPILTKIIEFISLKPKA